MNDKFGVILKTMCIVFLILWSLVNGAFPLGKSLFSSSVVLTLSKKPESQFGLIVPPEACWKISEVISQFLTLSDEIFSLSLD